MNEEALNIQEAAMLKDNPYTLAGWLSITTAVLFPFGIFLSFIHNIMLGLRSGFPPLGISDVVMVTATVFGVYVLIRFRGYMHEFYQYKGLDNLITANIIWMILYELFHLFLKSMITFGFIYLPHGHEPALTLVFSFFIVMAAFMITIGIIDLNIAIRLLRMKDSLGDMLRIFAYVTLVAGICELSLLFVPFTFVLYPVSCVVLGLALIKGQGEVEFV